MTPEQSAWVADYERTERLNETKERIMGRYASEEGSGSFVQAPEGTHVARCIRLIDIGTQHGEWQGKPTARNQVIVQWELPTELMEPGDDGKAKPFIVSRFYTNILFDKAAIYKDLIAWRGKDFTPEELGRFDLNTILGKPCLLTVTHNDKGKAKVIGVTKMVKGMECPPAVNELRSFWIEEWDQKQYDEMSDGFKRLIAASDEYAKLNAPPGATTKPTVDQFDDDIPFLRNAVMYETTSPLQRRLARSGLRGLPLAQE